MTNTLLTKTDIYLILKLDEYRAFLSNLAVWAIILFSVLLVSMVIYRVETKKGFSKGLTKYVLLLVIIPFVLHSIKTLLPTKNEMITMYVVPLIANNKHIRRIPQRILKILDGQLGKLDGYLSGAAKKKINSVLGK